MANPKVLAQQSARDLANDIVGPLGYAESMIDMCFDQVQTNDEQKAISNMIAAMDAANRYLKQIREICEQAMKGGANG